MEDDSRPARDGAFIVDNRIRGYVATTQKSFSTVMVAGMVLVDLQPVNIVGFMRVADAIGLIRGLFRERAGIGSAAQRRYGALNRRPPNQRKLWPASVETTRKRVDRFTLN